MCECNYCKAVFVFLKIQFLKNLSSGTHRGGFQFLLILDLWGMSIHAVIVFGLSKDLLLKSVLGHCECVESNPLLNDYSLVKLRQIE